MLKLDIDLAGRSYPIFIGNEALYNNKKGLRDCLISGRAVVVSDETVWALHGELLNGVLKDMGVEFDPVVVPQGEQSKSPAMLSKLYTRFVQSGLKRNDAVIAFGGGVVGDLAGFAASTYMRGVPFIQIPTTLLAQVDSSVGGKVAINLEEGKNLVGSFYQPRLVIADIGLLATLPRRELQAGMSEVVKYAAIGAESLTPLLADPDKTQDHIEEIVYLCCKCKSEYVERDERDTGERMMLNFGHTFGHAIEKYYAYEKYNHGEAVAVGMSMAAKAGRLMGVTSRSDEQWLLDLIRTNHLISDIETPIDEIIPLMMGDKKNSGGEITLVLLEKIGRPVVRKIEKEKLLQLFKEENEWKI